MKIVKTPNKEFDLSALYMDFTNNSNFHYDEEQYLVIKDISEAINTVLRTRKLIRFFKNIFAPQYKQVFYLHGSVGSGKSFITNLIFKNFPETPNKQRIRLTFYNLINELREQVHSIISGKNLKDSINVARDVVREKFINVDLLCIDEFHILDITDAVMIGEFLKIIFSNSKMFVLINSNRHPDELYKNGIHKERFLPIIDLIKKSSKVIPLSTKDYRNYQKDTPKNYFVSSDENSTIKSSEDFTNKYLDDNYHKCESHEIKIVSQKLKFLLNTHFTYKVAYFDFAQLFNRPFYAQNYEDLIKKLSLRRIFIANIPKLEGHDDWAKRFIAFIDIAYENKIYLAILSSVAVKDLYSEGKMVFEFNRTISRINSLCQ